MEFVENQSKDIYTLRYMAAVLARGRCSET